MKKSILALLPLSLILAGCGSSLIASPVTNPIIKDDAGGELTTIATTANRRLILVDHKGRQAGNYCAESSPDSVASFASLFSGNANATVQGQGNGSINFANALAASSGIITKRSQGLQFYRDGVFAYCQARHNGYMSQEEYEVAMRHLREQAMQLARYEIDRPAWTTTPKVVFVPAPTVPSSAPPPPPSE